MSDAVTELAQRGRELDARDRERLVDLPLDSLIEAPRADVEETWRLEVRRRIAAYEGGQAVLYGADDVMDEAKRLAL